MRKKKPKDKSPTGSRRPVNCANCCGACCLQQTSPPGFAMLVADDRRGMLCLHEAGPFAPDVDILAAMPAEVRATLETYVDQLFAGEHDGKPERPCIWLDLDSGRCKHYEHRPTICREGVEVGDAACLSWREEFADLMPRQFSKGLGLARSRVDVVQLDGGR
jgi:Fe-S-cluster containining protein